VSDDAAALRTAVERLAGLPAEDLPDDAETVFLRFRDALSEGRVRAAEPGADGWTVNAWVKQGILLGFRIGTIVPFPGESAPEFFDKHTYPVRRLAVSDGVRVVPGGSSIRSGAYVARGVVCMPPMYINVGAYVDEGTMVDSHALVGSCAQVGRHVHVSAAAQIGGVLEPIGARPVIVEDGALIGGNCGIYEGTLVGKEAVLAAGTVLTRSTAVYDLVNGTVRRGSAERPLAIPPRAMVVPGSRPARGGFAVREGVHLYTPVIVKYRDPGTDAAVALEDALR
jgi:2,3,4,5-tetrahydropyridine-2,6-dicarboxylate N-succinyltransferase